MEPSVLLQTLLLFNSIMCIMLSGLVWIKSGEIKKYKETAKQVVDMLRSYAQEPEDIDWDKFKGMTDEINDEYKLVQNMQACNIFQEMLQYIPKEDREDFREQFGKEK